MKAPAGKVPAKPAGKGVLKKKPFHTKVVFYSHDTAHDKKKIHEVLDKKTTDELRDIQTGPLYKGLLMNRNMFDKFGNTYGKYWGKEDKFFTGPKGHRLKYHPANDWIGYGITASKKYDSKDDSWLHHDGNLKEWWNVYHGIGRPANDVGDGKKVVGAILADHWKAGPRQGCTNDEDLNHPGQVCGNGSFFTPYPGYAEHYAWGCGFSGNFGLHYKNDKGENKHYLIGFRAKVNPNTTRIRKVCPVEFLSAGSANDARPITLMVKDVTGTSMVNHYNEYMKKDVGQNIFFK